MTKHFIIPNEALRSDIAILGKKGRGKSYAAKGLVERLLDLGERVLILDPLGHWWGLKASADGERPGYPVAVFGGHHADIEIGEKSGRILAEILVAEAVPAIIDMGAMRKGEQQRLVADLLDELFARNREPLTIVLEEADAFAPQSPLGDSIRVLSEVDRIARRGRAYGFRLLSITQRPAKLNKDVLTQLSVLIALGVTSPQDRDSIRSWVEGNGDRDKAKEVYDTLAGLDRGEGWVWAPDFDMLSRVHFPMIKTLDTSSTPQSGSKSVEPKQLAAADLARLRAVLQRSRVTADSGRPAVKAGVPPSLKEAEERGFERGKLAGEKLGRESAFREFASALERSQSVLSGAIGDLASIMQSLGSSPLPDKPAPFLPSPVKVPAASKRGSVSRPLRAIGKKLEPAREPLSADSGKLTPAARKFLLCAARVAPVMMTWGQLALLAQRKSRGGTFGQARRQLISAGYVRVLNGGLVQVQALGFEYLGEAFLDAAPSRDVLIERMLDVLPKSAREILEALVKARTPKSAEMLGELLGRAPSGGTWGMAIRLLKSNGLIEQTRDGFVVGDFGVHVRAGA